jgi:hypothetical protein
MGPALCSVAGRCDKAGEGDAMCQPDLAVTPEIATESCRSGTFAMKEKIAIAFVVDSSYPRLWINDPLTMVKGC